MSDTEVVETPTKLDALPVEETDKRMLPAAIEPEDPFLKMIEAVAMSPNGDVEKLREMLKMQTEIFDKNAKIKYAESMARAQGRMNAVVAKGRGEKNMTFARLEDIINEIKPIYSEEGFALSFGSDDCPIEGHYRVVCEVTHAGGHSKEFKMDLPNDMYGRQGNVNKTPIHAFGSTNSYGQRYIQKMIFNLAIQDEDNDGNNGQTVGQGKQGKQAEQLSAEVVASLRAALKEAGEDEAYLCKVATVNSIAFIEPERIKGAIAHLKHRAAKKAEQQGQE